ncbi:MAG: NYN domain-containing protein [bacterium]|nr:NYN domain-containing protein [bacterium]
MPNDLGQSQRQDIYLQALAPLGSRDRRREVPAAEKNVMVRQTGKIAKARLYEENGTDVNLAVDLVTEALSGTVDQALVICNDSDLQRAVDRAMESGVKVFVANPCRPRSGGNVGPTAWSSSVISTASPTNDPHLRFTSSRPSLVVI